MSATLQKLLAAQLHSHVRLHLGAPTLPRIRVLDSARKPAKRLSAESHILEIVAKLEVYSSTTGTVALTGIAGVKRSGTILLVRPSEGEPFHVELARAGKTLTVTRVSSGGTAKDLEKALERAASKTRGKGSEFRVLRVPAMHLSAVWRRYPNKPGADAFIAYTQNFVGLRVGQAYTRQGIERVLKQHATQMILRWYERHEKTDMQPMPGDQNRGSS
jgi:hypothetical protein